MVGDKVVGLYKSYKKSKRLIKNEVQSIKLDEFGPIKLSPSRSTLNFLKPQITDNQNHK